MIHSKDGTPMRAGPHPILAQGKVRYVGDHVAVVIAETLTQAKDAAEAIVVDYDVLPAVVEASKAQAKGAPQVHTEAPPTRSMTGISATRRRRRRPSRRPSTSPASTSSTTASSPTPWSRARPSANMTPAMTR